MAKIEDFGPQIGGARKDRFAGMQLRDISTGDWAAYFEERRMTKDQILGIYDYREMVLAGRPADLCYIIKGIRDAIPITPRLSRIKPEYRDSIAALYVECLETLSREFAAAQQSTDLLRLDLKLIPQMTEEKGGKTYLTERASWVCSALGGNRGFLAVQVYENRISEAGEHVQQTGWPFSPRQDGTDALRPPDLERPILEHLLRDRLPDWRAGADVDQRILAEVFGFRAGEFGNWATAAERQEFCNRLHDALKDLGSLLGVPDRALSMHGRLAIAFGSRGKANSAAHYEPVLKVIHCTKKRWMGSVAHEWAHALDHLLLDKFSELQHGSGSLADQYYLSSSFFADYRRGHVRAGRVTHAMRNLFSLWFAPSSGCQMNYVEHSLRCDRLRSKRYFSLPEEMFARSVEFSVACKMGKERSDWLVHSARNDDYENSGVKPYPEMARAHAYVAWFDEFIMAAKEVLGADFHLLPPSAGNGSN